MKKDIYYNKGLTLLKYLKNIYKGSYVKFYNFFHNYCKQQQYMIVKNQYYIIIIIMNNITYEL